MNLSSDVFIKTIHKVHENFISDVDRKSHFLRSLIHLRNQLRKLNGNFLIFLNYSIFLI